VITDVEPAQAPQPEPQSGTTMPSESSRPRWLMPVAVGLILLAVVIGVILGLTLSGQRKAGAGASAAAGYVPAAAPFYYELRLDLPGDQRAALRSFLGHFPQLDADKYLTSELDRQLDLLTQNIPNNYSYSRDVKPWFDGKLAFALASYPSVAPKAKFPELLVFAGVRNSEAATAFSNRLLTQATTAGAQVTSTTHAGATIWSISGPGGGPSASLEMAGVPKGFAWTITADEVIGAFSADQVASALDVHSGARPSLAGRSEFSAGLEHLPGDRVLIASVDTKAMYDQLQKDLAAQPSAAAVVAAMAARSPSFTVMSARFENDRFVLDSSAPAVAGMPGNAERGLAALAPKDAIFFAESGDVGARLAEGVDYLKAMLGISGALPDEQLDQVEAVLGGDLKSFVSWMGDSALVAGDNTGVPYFGLIVTPANAHDASVKLHQVQGLLQLAGSNGGPRVRVSEQDHSGTQITTIQFEASKDVPSWASAFQFALNDQRVVIGSGDSFVARVLDMQAADSLAGSDRYRKAMDSVGGLSNAGSFWLDLTALRTAAERFIPAEGSAAYTTQVRPWLVPLDYVVGAGRPDAGQQTSRFALVVK
jgi:hypothetical protein